MKQYHVRWWWVAWPDEGSPYAYSLHMQVEGMQSVWLGDIIHMPTVHGKAYARRNNKMGWSVLLAEADVISEIPTAREAADWLLDYLRGKELS